MENSKNEIQKQLNEANSKIANSKKDLQKLINAEKEKQLKDKNNSKKNFDKEKEKLMQEIEELKKKGKEEIYNDYDHYLELFKESLFGVIMDVIGSVNEIDLLITLIRKLPCVLDFYGRSKSNEFCKFIINNFNKGEWIIQKEILIQIPKMMNILGKNVLDDYILPCMEMLIANNSNEFKTYKLIEAINKLLKMEILSSKNAIDFLLGLLPYSIHPNWLIHKEILDLIKNLIIFLSPEEIFGFL